MAKEKDLEKFDAVQFDDEIIPQIVDFFGREVNESNGLIMDMKVGDIEVDHYSGEELNSDNFGGVLPGSKIFISKNTASLAEYIRELRNKYAHNIFFHMGKTREQNVDNLGNGLTLILKLRDLLSKR